TVAGGKLAGTVTPPRGWRRADGTEGPRFHGGVDVTRRSPVVLQRLALSVVLGTIVVLAAQPHPALPPPGDISAGAGTGSFNGSSTGGDGDGGPAVSANIPGPYGVVSTGPGTYYFSQGSAPNIPDYTRVRVVQNGTINSAAGGAVPPSPDGV